MLAHSDSVYIEHGTEKSIVEVSGFISNICILKYIPVHTVMHVFE